MITYLKLIRPKVSYGFMRALRVSESLFAKKNQFKFRLAFIFKTNVLEIVSTHNTLKGIVSDS
jgi:hypothetical protein